MSNDSKIDEVTEIERIEFQHEEANKMVQSMRKKMFRNEKQIEKWIEVLKEKNAINDQGAHGFTLLMHAVLTLRPKIISWLVKNGADPTIPSNNGIAPVHVAAELDKPIYLKSLLISKEVANSTNPNYSLSPLHRAVTSNRVKNIILLLDMGADINAPDSVNNTPLKKALAPTDFPIARLLLERGADPFIKNNNGYNYIDHLESWEGRRDIFTQDAQDEFDDVVALVKKLYPGKL